VPSFQPEARPVTINGKTVYLRGTLEYDVNTGARIATSIRDVLTYRDVIARAGVSGTPTVTYTDVNGTRTIGPTDTVQPLDGSSFTVR
jgi:hypothetical protein